jgi:hypothetical protein
MSWEHEGAEDIKKHVRIYITVFVALAALTVVTVGISYLHLPTHLAIILALIVATVKGSQLLHAFDFRKDGDLLGFAPRIHIFCLPDAVAHVYFTDVICH